MSYERVRLPLVSENKQAGAPPPAWLIYDESAFPARNAAFETWEAHVDPAAAFSELPLIVIPEQAQFVVVIATDSVIQFRASVVQWDPEANPLPLIETHGEQVACSMRAEGEFTVFTLTAIYPFQEQFLHFYITFSQPSSPRAETGYAHYLWRITYVK
jgi:NADPH-dependent ferric siderophore reductase